MITLTLSSERIFNPMRYNGFSKYINGNRFIHSYVFVNICMHMYIFLKYMNEKAYIQKLYLIYNFFVGKIVADVLSAVFHKA